MFRTTPESSGSGVGGCENHSGETYLGEDVAPLGMVLKGYGNNGADGTEGARAKKSRKLAELVGQESGLPVRMWDERQTTSTAAGFLSESGTFGKKRKAILDAVSASVILENSLAWRKNHPGQE